MTPSPRALSVPLDLADSDLLAHIARAPRSAQSEMQEFYGRHVRYLHAVVRKHCSRLGFDATEVEDLVHDTFQRAFDRAETFRSSTSPDPEQQRRWCRAWLGTIARNLILTALRGHRETPATDLLEVHPVKDRESDPPSGKNLRLAALQEAIATLDDREQDVLRISAMHYRAGVTHQRLPNEVSQELAARWQTTNENIRAIRSRALKRVTMLAAELLQREPAVEDRYQ